MSAAYSCPSDWALGADAIYERLADAIVAASPSSLSGLTVVDLGAGTGATTRAIAKAGGSAVAVDVSHPMLHYRSSGRPPSVAADIAGLPLRDSSVDAAFAAFSLSHVEDPVAVLREAARVVVPGGPIVVGVFAEVGDRHAVKTIVDRVAREFGYTDPDWYLHLKADLEPQVASAQALCAVADGAGLANVIVTDVVVDTGCSDPADLVRWRLGGAALAPFVAGLPEPDRDRMIARATTALGAAVQPLRPVVRILASLAPATRSSVAPNGPLARASDATDRSASVHHRSMPEAAAT